MSKKRFEKPKKTKEESLLDIQINYHKLMFNKLREVRSLNKNYSILKSITSLYLDNNEDHHDVYAQEKEALRYCLKNMKKIKQIDEELKVAKPLLISKTKSVNSSTKNNYKNEKLMDEVNDIELLINMITNECKNECLIEYQLLKEQSEENKKLIKNESNNLNN